MLKYLSILAHLTLAVGIFGSSHESHALGVEASLIDLSESCQDGAEISIPIFTSMTDVKMISWNGTAEGGGADCMLRVSLYKSKHLHLLVKI